MCAIKYTARQRIKAVSYKLQLKHWQKEQHVQIAVTHYGKKNKLMVISTSRYFLWNKKQWEMALSQLFPTSENSNSLFQSRGKNALKMECIKQDRKRHNFGLLPADDSPYSSPLQLRPLNASSLESTVALVASWSTPNLWPLTPGTTEFITEASAQFAQRGAHPVSGRDDDRRERQWVQVLQMFFTPTPLLLCLLFIFTTHCTRSHKIPNTVFQALNLWLWVFSCHGRSHLSWCSRVRKEDPAVPWWKAARYREI